MRHWKETEQICDRVAELLSLGRTGAIATVVRIRGSAYRRPGARFLVEDDGRTQGSISGGCLEADVREVARAAVIPNGTVRLLHYDTGSDDRVVWGLGLGCNGSVDVFVQRIDGLASGMLDHLRELLRRDSAFAMSTIIDGQGTGQSVLLGRTEDGAREVNDEADGARQDTAGPSGHEPGLQAIGLPKVLREAASRRLASGESGVDEADGWVLFTDVLVPPPHLIVCGAGDDARPVVACAAGAGFQVTVVDHRPALLTAERFPEARRLLQSRPDSESSVPINAGASVVLMTHSFGLDREWLRRFLATEASYIGVLGPRARIEEMLRQLDAGSEERVFGPAGLDMAADGPEQIAISIVAEVLGVHARRVPRHLREREVPIHAG